ncbi:MAG: SDR family NAD(P)-dependent oxidoreductase [Candidatus Aminicenantes bacterium RBG_16_66_30]
MRRTPFKTALITGASAGLGAEFARQLAAAGTDVILVARRLDRLEDLAKELGAGHSVRVETVQADLSTDEGLAVVEKRIAEHPALDLLVNNAGFGGRNGFVKGETADHLKMVGVHVDATIRLTKAALTGMIDRGRGAVINLASIAAFSAFSGAMYSGTKAFLVMFSQNLQDEVRRKGIVIQALCPGMTHTDFHRVAEIDKSIVPKPFWMTASKVVRISLRRVGRGVVCVPGWKNKIIAFAMRCPATAVIVRLVGRTMTVRARTGEN